MSASSSARMAASCPRKILNALSQVRNTSLCSMSHVRQFHSGYLVKFSQPAQTIRSLFNSGCSCMPSPVMVTYSNKIVISQRQHAKTLLHLFCKFSAYLATCRAHIQIPRLFPSLQSQIQFTFPSLFFLSSCPLRLVYSVCLLTRRD